MSQHITASDLRGSDFLQSASGSWRVLVVEKDQGALETLRAELGRHGHQVKGVHTGSAALQAHESADIVLIDFELPDIDGLEVCRGIRTLSDVAVIAVTSWGSELDRVLGLQAGADDYVVKPYGCRELIARMEAVMRRVQAKPQTAKVISHGSLRIDVGLREVSLEGREVDVTRKEFDLLCLLASHPRTVIPRKRIMQQVWGDSWSRRTVDTHVSSLRAKLGGSDWIITVRGVGFRLGHI
ncbi:response regulator transcription factor [Streptomyces sp. B1866]|uniref:response regulator transcription factor n=1 Tax=Streptomyces sp. B1866 TaxID=3075431 RepID=UPI002891D736|nr:response regulator transcription factor [Streptomyces sp. B1866]MDT3397080.1 response regulator transcription factor [Streptomyces sp. B1866]